MFHNANQFVSTGGSKPRLQAAARRCACAWRRSAVAISLSVSPSLSISVYGWILGRRPHTWYRFKNFPTKGNPHRFSHSWVSEAIRKMGIGTARSPIGFRTSGYR